MLTKSSITLVSAVFMTVAPELGLAQSSTPNIFGPDRTVERIEAYHKGDLGAAWLPSVSSPWEAVFTAAIALHPECRPGSPIIALRRLLAVRGDAQAAMQFEQIAGKPYGPTVAALRAQIAKEFGEAVLAAVDGAVGRASVIQQINLRTPPIYQRVEFEESPCASSQQLPTRPVVDPASQLICVSAAALRARGAGGANASYLRDLVKISIDTSDISPEARIIILDAALTSLAIWIAACGNCGDSAFTVLEDYDAFYIVAPILKLAREGRLATPFRRPSLGAPVSVPVAGSPVARTESSSDAGTWGWVSGVKFRSLLGRLSRAALPLSKFARVAKGSGELAGICSSQVDKTLEKFRAALCQPDSASLAFKIALAEDGKTGCTAPSGRKVIACEDPAVGVQLNVKDFRFEDASGRGFGAGETVDLVRIMLHETGHWLGFGHTEPHGGVDIMAASYKDAICFSEMDVFTIEGGKALEPPIFPSGMALIE